MATYKEIVGQKITKVTSDPSDPKTGQMWYNSTDGNLRGLGILEAWSSASSTINAKQRPGGCGTQTAGLAAGGLTAPPASALGTTEEYNGSGWSSGGNLNTARGNVGMAGTQTAAVFSGKGSPGTPYAGTTELYDGTSWTTNPNSANDTYNYRSNCGIQTAALFTGGNYPPTNRAAGNEEFNGTSFSEGGDLPQKQSSQGQAGTQTAAINSFGTTNSPVPGNSGDGDNAISLEYDGTSWTAGPNGNGVVPLAGYSMGSGTQTDALFAGGPPTNSCKYDGTTFTVGPALATAHPSSANGSSSASATWIAHGSPVPSVGTDTQEFNRSTNTITAAAWAAGGVLNTARRSMFTGPMGTQTAGLAAGGYVGPARTNATEEYNGSSWTSVNNTTDTLSSRGGAGTQTAGLLFGGNPSPSTVTDTEEYDGTNWTAGGALNNARGYGPIAAGTQTAALCAGGYNPPVAHVTVVEYYNGLAWTAQPNANPNNYAGASGGTQDAAWFIGLGAVSPGPANTEAYNWDGTSWTASGNYGTTSVANCFGGGTQTAGWMCGGDADPGFKSFTNHYDGTVWSTAPSLGTARSGYGQSGIQSSGLIFGGGTPSNTTATEEFTGETLTANVTNFDTE